MDVTIDRGQDVKEINVTCSTIDINLNDEKTGLWSNLHIEGKDDVEITKSVLTSLKDNLDDEKFRNIFEEVMGWGEPETETTNETLTRLGLPERDD